MRELESTIDTCLAVVEEPDPRLRLQAVRKVFTEDATFTNDMAEVQGAHAVAAAIGQLRDLLPPGSRVVRTSTIEGARTTRYLWATISGDGEMLFEGMDVATIAADGRIASLAVFSRVLPSPRDAGGPDGSQVRDP